jgi:hypothetical protein
MKASNLFAAAGMGGAIIGATARPTASSGREVDGVSSAQGMRRLDLSARAALTSYCVQLLHALGVELAFRLPRP